MQGRVVVGVGAFSSILAAALGVQKTTAGAPLAQEPQGVVIVIDDAPAEPELIETMSHDRWHRDVGASIASVLTALRDVRAAMPEGGRIVVVVPTVGITGAAGLVSYATAVEGVRAMAKSAARQWASEGIRINMVAVPIGAMAPALASVDAHLSAPALGGEADLLPAITRTVAVLLDGELDHLVGATLTVDGGSVMLP